MTSSVIKRSIVIEGHKTSVSLEDKFWASLKEIAKRRSLTLSELARIIDEERGGRANLSSAMRLFVLAHFRALCSPPATSPAQPNSESELRSARSPAGPP